MKKRISLFLAILLIFTATSASALALPSSNDIISFDEFYSELKAEYAKYNIDLTIEQPNLSYVYTRGFLEEQLEAARLMDKSIHTLTEDELEQYATHKEKSKEKSEVSMSTQSLASMTPVPFSWSMNGSIYWGTWPGFQSYTVSCTGMVDIENGQVISHSSSIRKTSSLNVASSSLSVSASKHNGGVAITLYIDGQVTFDWTEPKTGMRYGYTAYGPFTAVTIYPENEI